MSQLRLLRPPHRSRPIGQRGHALSQGDPGMERRRPEIHQHGRGESIRPPRLSQRLGNKGPLLNQSALRTHDGSRCQTVEARSGLGRCLRELSPLPPRPEEAIRRGVFIGPPRGKPRLSLLSCLRPRAWTSRARPVTHSAGVRREGISHAKGNKKSLHPPAIASPHRAESALKCTIDSARRPCHAPAHEYQIS